MLETMKAGRHPSLRATIAVVGLTLTLLILAWLQYRWINEVSRGHRQRMQAAMVTAVRQFQAELSRELFTLGAAFRPDFRSTRDRGGGLYAGRWEAWRQTASYPDLLKQVFFAEMRQGEEARISQLDRDGEEFTEVEWPEHFDAARRYLNRGTADGERPSRMGFGRPVLIARIGLLMIPQPPRPSERRLFRAGARPLPAYLLLELDRAFLGEQMLPELATRHFVGEPGFVYEVAVFLEDAAASAAGGASTPSTMLFSSNPALTADSFAAAEMRVPLLFDPGALAGRARRLGGPGPEGRGRRRGFGRGGPPLIAAPEGRWVLAVKHPEGSLDAVAESFRRRNLAVGLGILLVLGLTMGMILVSSNRAQRLAKLQMDFVAGVSHELKQDFRFGSSDGTSLHPHPAKRNHFFTRKRAAAEARPPSCPSWGLIAAAKAISQTPLRASGRSISHAPSAVLPARHRQRPDPAQHVPNSLRLRCPSARSRNTEHA